MCSNLEAVNEDLKAVGALPQDDVDQRSPARAPTDNDEKPKVNEEEIPPKKRKTRRGRNKRRHPYLKNAERKPWNVIKPEAPHNSNQFLIEDHGNAKEIDERLKNDQMMGRTRDSSFSMDSDGEFYSSPDDEEAFLRKDFDDTYENLRAERLNLMSKNELIEEFLQLEKKVDFLTKRMKGKSADIDIEDEKEAPGNSIEFQKEIERLLIENETLKRENNDLRNKISVSNSDSEDSESDSSDSCSSCSSSGSESVKEENALPSPEEAAVVDYTQTNGHSPTTLQPV